MSFCKSSVCHGLSSNTLQSAFFNLCNMDSIAEKPHRCKSWNTFPANVLTCDHFHACTHNRYYFQYYDKELHMDCKPSWFSLLSHTIPLCAKGVSNNHEHGVYTHQ